MKKIASNIIANFFGKVYIALLAIVMVPIYIRYLGIESYGLVGFYTTLLGSFAILDFGLSTTLNREIAKARATSADPSQLRNLVFTLETVYWVMGVVICLVILLLSGTIANHWLKAEHISAVTIQRSIFLMGLVIAFQWPVGLYHGGLMGMEKQVLFNVISIIMMTLRAVGVLLILIFVSSTIEAFFIWQVAINLLYALWMRYVVWKHLTVEKPKRKFSVASLKLIWKFAAGLTSTGIVAFFLTQADKILLSKILPLQEFAYYTLAFTISSSLTNFTTPISSAVFPKFSGLAASHQFDALKNIYHQASRLTASVIIPVALTLVLFAPEILMVWLKNADTVAHTSNLVRLLVIGTMFNSFMMTPYLLTLAFGWTRFSFYQNLIAAIILVPLLFWWTHLYGALGATFVWLSINVFSTLISVPLIHKRILPGQTKKWYLQDNLIPLFFSGLISVGMYMLYRNCFGDFKFNYVSLVILFVFSCAVSFLQFPNLKNYVRNLFANKNVIRE
ncbi:oligosaccharide flippase family protein [Ferruginibacter sp. SUN106]|uniref:oligosaccharide flippase family protein n=1 Tax=Ferruginibacter sp. SUN106 TaxID=2978348 RepID=UPI003D362023